MMIRRGESSMTRRLYYEDAYLTDFEARVLSCRAEGERFSIALDRSAFYPTSGGQPYDVGTLGGARVLDVYVDEAGDVAHVTDRPLEVNAFVAGKIDWARRFDHMQQHAGDHMMAGVIHRELSGYTVGLHVGAVDSTIDVVLPDGRMRLDEAEIREIERQVNEQIQRDLPIRCWFPDADELMRLPLRKAPTVTDRVRVVMVGDVECVACGGTHPSSSGQLGAFKILDARPSRGKLRVSFVCGMRAMNDYQLKSDAAKRAAQLFSTKVELMPDAVLRLIERVKKAETELKKQLRGKKNEQA